VSASDWILVVDDDDSIRELVSMIIEARGYEVETAQDGAEALARLVRPTPPALVLLDLMMPGVDGVTFLREFRSRPQFEDVPVVVLTGDARAIRRIDGLEVQDCMSKPIELDDLVRTVERYAAA
jgi:two-component system, OmpR family, alkaline phosphatase synthesis response regulator PhoP